MSAPQGDFDVVVTAVRRPAADVVELELAGRDGATLPSWMPGAHIDLLLPNGVVRQYSLAGDPSASTWRLGVLREAEGRGGSLWIADRVQVGMILRAAGPRNRFAGPDLSAGDAPLIFVAGGIGITPILPLAAAADVAGRELTIHYSGHTPRMPFVEELRERFGARLVLHDSDAGERLDIPELLTGSARGTQIVTCGPARLLDALEMAAGDARLDIHLERFTPESLAPPVWAGPFEVELALTGVTVVVPPERSILAVAEEAGAFVLSSCTEGTCGTCETPVLEGDVDHRDSILTAAQRARNDIMFVCVSRAACPRLVLDL